MKWHVLQQMNNMKHFSSFFLCVAALLLASCTNTKLVSYFNGVPDGTLPGKTVLPEVQIQRNDLLYITVSSLNADASALFNMPVAATTNAEVPLGYLVNQQGQIQFPVLGLIKAEGLTKDQLKTQIENTLSEKQLLKDPIVSIRFLNFRVTVLGEVNQPKVVQVPSEKISLLEALGMAGDLTIYGKRENVLVIREEDGVKSIKRINLNSDELLKSPYYYLKSNDIVYVEPNKQRIQAANTTNTQIWISLALAVLTLATIFLTRAGL